MSKLTKADKNKSKITKARQPRLTSTTTKTQTRRKTLGTEEIKEQGFSFCLDSARLDSAQSLCPSLCQKQKPCLCPKSAVICLSFAFSLACPWCLVAVAWCGVWSHVPIFFFFVALSLFRSTVLLFSHPPSSITYCAPRQGTAGAGYCWAVPQYKKQYSVLLIVDTSVLTVFACKTECVGAQ
jgi:hypothetical protein